MAKLQNLKSSLSTLSSALDPPASDRDWKRWYRTERWRRIRVAVLKRDGFTCVTCKVLFVNTSRLVCDHVEPHRGDPVRFWNGPFQTLCDHCHSSIKQRKEFGK